MKRIVYMLCALTVLFFFTGCGSENVSSTAGSETEVIQSANTDAAEETEKKIAYTTTADLMHNHNPLTIQLERERYKEIGDFYFVRVYDEAFNLVWESKQISYRHAESNIFCLIQQEEGDYILQYVPDYGTGCCVYNFTVFHFDEDGQMVTDDEDQVEFVAEPSETWNEKEMYPADQMEEFANHLNQYLENGYLLIDTCYHERLYSTDDKQITFEEHYQSLFTAPGLTETATDDTAENIAAYKRYLLGEQKK